MTWNASSLNTALPNIYNLISNSTTSPTIITIQETKLTATKSTKYIQNLFPEYKLIFNNTHALTRCIQQRMPYTPARGGLLTLINNKYAYPGNITKIPTPAEISPYLQIIQIQNTPLQSWLIIHIYMPSHLEDLQYIIKIQQQITQQISAHPNHSHILCGDFNRDIALIGRQNESNITPPQTEDIEWRTFTDTLNLTYIPTNSTFTRQGGQNYTQTNLIDGYYIQTPNNTLYTSTTNHDHNLNSDHSPVTLQIPPNTLLARPTQPKINKPPRILNPIPQDNIEKLKILFFEENSLQINELTSILMNEHLTDNQWQTSCTKLDYLIQQISTKTQETCSAPPLPELSHRTTQQGGFLPRKLQKQWKKHLSTYHLIRKAIYITKNIPLWQNHPVIEELKNHNHINIPPPPHPNINLQEWIKTIAELAKTANKQARKITTKYTQECIKKTITKYRQLYEKNPKKINNKVFKNQDTPSLDCIRDRNNNILTSAEDIAYEIHIQQSISNRPTVPTCYYQPEHTNNCTCGVKQYPWHDLDGFIIDTRGDPQIPLHKYFDQETYDLCLKYLSNNKTPGPDKIPNSILKNMPDNFHKMLLLFFTHCYKQKKSLHHGKQV
jgi:exonuclease III